MEKTEERKDLEEYGYKGRWFIASFIQINLNVSVCQLTLLILTQRESKLGKTTRCSLRRNLFPYIHSAFRFILLSFIHGVLGVLLLFGSEDLCLKDLTLPWCLCDMVGL